MVISPDAPEPSDAQVHLALAFSFLQERIHADEVESQREKSTEEALTLYAELSVRVNGSIYLDSCVFFLIVTSFFCFCLQDFVGMVRLAGTFGSELASLRSRNEQHFKEKKVAKAEAKKSKVELRARSAELESV